MSTQTIMQGASHRDFPLRGAEGAGEAAALSRR
jgi:hypothetical protein